KKIENRDLRGFLIRKQGFSIGKRSDLQRFFVRTTFFDRFIGEVVVVHPQLIPNAPRSQFEPSPLREEFFLALGGVARRFNEYANEYQEKHKADYELEQAIEKVRLISASLPSSTGNMNALLDLVG